QTLRDQRDREPMDGALRQPEAPRERADADFDLVLRERLEQSNRGRDRGQPFAPSAPVCLSGSFLSRLPSKRQVRALSRGSAFGNVVPKQLAVVLRASQ